MLFYSRGGNIKTLPAVVSIFLILCTFLNTVAFATGPNFQQEIENFLETTKTPIRDKFILKVRQKHVSKLLTKCRASHCTLEQISEILDIYTRDFKSKLRGHALFTGIFVVMSVALSIAKKELPGAAGNVQALTVVLYASFSATILTKNSAKLMQWGYRLKSGKTGRVSAGANDEFTHIFEHLRHKLDYTEEEARDSLARALASITSPLLSLSLEKDKSSILKLQKIISTSFINLRVLHVQIEPNQPSLVRTIRGYLLDYANDIDFRDELLEHIKANDPAYVEHFKYYNTLFSHVFSELADIKTLINESTNHFSGTAEEFLLIRDILNNGGAALDYDKWGRDFSGLDETIFEYMLRQEYNSPYDQNMISKVRQQIITAVTKEELELLKWQEGKNTTPQKFNMIKFGRHFKSQRKVKQTSSLKNIDFKTSVNKAFRK